MSTTESFQDVVDRLNAKAAEPTPESWKAEKPGDVIYGKIRRYEKGSTSWGDCVICVLESLRTPGRLVSVWIFGTVLANAFQRLQPQRGEAIRVEYLGEVHPEGGGAAYKNWSVAVDRDATNDGLDFYEAFAGTQAPPERAEPTAPRQEFPTTGDFHADAEPSAAAPAPDDTDDIPF